MPDANTALGWIGQRIDDVYGGRLGKVEEVYADERTGRPLWLAIRVGRFGDEHVPVPAGEAVEGEGGVWVPYERQVVRAAGTLACGEPITPERDRALAAHYALPDADGRGQTEVRPLASAPAPRA